MLDKIIQTVAQETFKEGVNKKFDIQGKILEVAKTYWKYLMVGGILVLILIVIGIWLAWTLLSGAISKGSTMIPDGSNLPDLQKVQEVGINGILDQPLQFLKDIWVGNDGK